MASLKENENRKPGPNGDTAATSSWSSKLNALCKAKFPAKSPTSKKPPLTKGGALTSEGKTFKDSDGDSKADKWKKIKDARKAKEGTKTQKEENLSAIELVESMVDNKLGNFQTIFELLLKDKITSLVEERRAQLLAVIYNEQAVEEPEEETDEDAISDEELDEISDDDLKLSEDEINELSVALKNKYANKARVHVSSRSGKAVDPKAREKLLKRMKYVKKTNEGNEEVDEFIDSLDPDEIEGLYMDINELEETPRKNNVKPHVHHTKSGNTEKKAHHEKTRQKLLSMSPDKVRK